jgi:hypothetical protein
VIEISIRQDSLKVNPNSSAYKKKQSECLNEGIKQISLQMKNIKDSVKDSFHLDKLKVIFVYIGRLSKRLLPEDRNLEMIIVQSRK